MNSTDVTSKGYFADRKIQTTNNREHIDNDTQRTSMFANCEMHEQSSVQALAVCVHTTT